MPTNGARSKSIAVRVITSVHIAELLVFQVTLFFSSHAKSEVLLHPDFTGAKFHCILLVIAAIRQLHRVFINAFLGQQVAVVNAAHLHGIGIFNLNKLRNATFCIEHHDLRSDATHGCVISRVFSFVHNVIFFELVIAHRRTAHKGFHILHFARSHEFIMN